MPQHRTQSKTTCLLKKKVAEGHLLKYKTCTQRLNFQRIQDLPQLINKKPTQNTKQNHMLIKKEGGRMRSQTGQDMPQHRTQSKTTCLLKKKVAEGHLLKYKTCTQRLNFQRIQDLPQLINKKPTQNTKQNHMLIKKKVAEGHLPKYKTCPQLLS